MRLMLLPLLSVVACEAVDPRPVCGFSLEIVDAEVGSVALREQDSVACTPSEAIPDRVEVEALRVGDQPVTDGDLAVLCNSENLYTALSLEGLGPDDLSLDLFGELPASVSVVAENPEFVEEGGWYQVSFMRSLETGGMVAEQPWIGQFQLGVAGSGRTMDDCEQ